MGSYREIKGDLLELFDKGEFDIIAHGANTMRKMDAGIALQIKNKYPSVYYADLYDTRNSLQKYGDYSFNENIYNLYTQLLPGPYADITAIKMCLKKLNYLFYSNINKISIGLPLIGCGIGGLKWEYVKPIIQEELQDMNVTVVFYDK